MVVCRFVDGACQKGKLAAFQQQADGFLTAKSQSAFLVIAEPLVKARMLVADFAQRLLSEVNVDFAQIILI